MLVTNGFRNIFFAALLAVAGVLVMPSQAIAQDKEKIAEEMLGHASNAASIAEQIAKQGGRVVGGRTGANIASPAGSMVTILTNFDELTCNISVMALSVKLRNLTIAAAAANNPALDANVVKLRDLVAKLQALCNKYVNKVPTGIGTGGSGSGTAGTTTGGDAETTDEPDTSSSSGYNADEKICLRKCGKKYRAYREAKRRYDIDRKYAEVIRKEATEKRAAANKAKGVAEKAKADAENAARLGAELRRELTDARVQSERIRLAGEIANLRESSKKLWADARQADFEKADKEAKAAEAKANKAEQEAAAAYEVMKTLYEAWLACAKKCQAMSKKYRNVDIDIFDLFYDTRTLPPAPPYYTPPRPQTGGKATTGKKVSRVILPPAGFSGGMLAGVVIDDLEQPQEEAQVAVELPDGTEEEVSTGGGGIFAVTAPAIIGTVVFNPPEIPAEPATDLPPPGLPGSPELPNQPQPEPPDGMEPPDPNGGMPTPEEQPMPDPEPMEIELVEQVPEELPYMPGSFLDLANPIMLGMPYLGVDVAQAGDPLMGSAPTAVAIAPDGIEGMTTIALPGWLQPGDIALELQTPDGEIIAMESAAYRFVNGWIESEKLRSGQRAEFGFDLDFGSGPQVIMVTIATSGPIVYDLVGQPQPIEVGADGMGRFTGTVQALQGSPAGIPFSIVPTFSSPEVEE